MQLPVRASQHHPASSVAVSDAIFSCDFNETLVHQVVVDFRLQMEVLVAQVPHLVDLVVVVVPQV